MKWPNAPKRELLERIPPQVLDDFDVDNHFSPDYFPWEQRLCDIPDGDFCRALH